jgi:hypothetical protein
MKKINLIFILLFVSSCGSTPAVLTETKIKYVDRVVVQDNLICCNCEPMPMCEHEGKLITNGQLAVAYVCLEQQKQLENELKKQCKVSE